MYSLRPIYSFQKLFEELSSAGVAVLTIREVDSEHKYFLTGMIICLHLVGFVHVREMDFALNVVVGHGHDASACEWSTYFAGINAYSSVSTLCVGDDVSSMLDFN